MKYSLSMRISRGWSPIDFVRAHAIFLCTFLLKSEYRLYQFPLKKIQYCRSLELEGLILCIALAAGAVFSRIEPVLMGAYGHGPIETRVETIRLLQKQMITDV